MDETVLMPSPNWFQVSVMAASPDGWLVYGGPSKSLCVLEPIAADYNATIKGNSGYKAHVISRAHPEKIVSVDLSPEWPEKKSILTGSVDGQVKQWRITKQDGSTKIKMSLVHEVHSKDKEHVVGVGYSNGVYAVSVGLYGNIVKWDVNSNVVKTYSQFLKSFKPNCMKCSHHIELNVAIGTKQGVVLVIDLNGQGTVLYKIRAHDEEIINLGWCPQYEVEVRKALKDTATGLSSRLEKIRNEHDDDNVNFENKAVASGKSPEPEKIISELPDTQQEPESSEPEIVQEDDMFDIYKDHEADEFGHKKFQPEEIYVKEQKENVQSDFLAECLKLKSDILKRKTEPEPSIESLVAALDNTHVDEEKAEPSTTENVGGNCSKKDMVKKTESSPSSVHIHRHLLATIGRNGSVRVWSKSGKLVSSCTVANGVVKQRNKVPGWVALLWYRPNLLLIGDGKSQLLECDPTAIDCKNKLSCHPIHNFHKRGLYCITSSAPKVLLPSTNVEDWPVWTVAQDRSIIQYALKERKVLNVYNTCGGFVYTVATCPYDARKSAVSVGDGAIRIWEADTLEGDESFLTRGRVSTYWQSVQGKVLTVAWHPTRENLLAFATAEARVGLIDTSPRSEKPATVLRPVLNSGVYALCWGAENDLYACGGGELVVYKANNVEAMPTPIQVELEGKQWKLTEVKWSERALLVGSTEGAVAALTATRPHNLVAAAFPYTKAIHCVEWHPQQVSESEQVSPNKNLIATCSAHKHGPIVILQLAENEEGEIKLSVWKTLTEHKAPVLRVAWNPHREGLLLSTSQDSTIRVWDVVSGVCTSVFAGHSQATLGVAWSGFPSLADAVLSGGSDCAMRLWRTPDHPADKYIDPKGDATKKDKKKNKQNAAQSAKDVESSDDSDDESKQVAASLDKRVRCPKKFLFPLMHKEINQDCLTLCKAMLRKYVEKNGGTPSEKETNGLENGDASQVKTNGEKCDVTTLENGGDVKEDKTSENGDAVEEEVDCVSHKIFGSTNDVNEVLESELARHVEASNHEAWIMVSILRGNIDSVFQYAVQRDLICPFLLSIAPSVSFKYWKDSMQLYLAQIDRLVAKNEGKKLTEKKRFGGPIYRKVASLLSLHDVKGAVAVLTEAQQFKDAYVLCRVRHMDSIAEEILQKWAEDNIKNGALPQAAVCYLGMGDLSRAASALGKTNDEDNLNLAAILAKISGQTTYADHFTQKSDQIKLSKDNAESIEEALQELPSRVELLLREDSGN